MDKIREFIDYSKESYKKDNYIEISFCNSNNNDIFDIGMDKDKVIDCLKEFRNYKLNYAQGKLYRVSDLVCYSFYNKNLITKREAILEKDCIDYDGKKILIVNKDINDYLDLPNLKEYNLEEEYEVFNIYINKDIAIIVENTNENYTIKIRMNIQKDIPQTFLDEYLNGIKENIEILLEKLY